MKSFRFTASKCINITINIMSKCDHIVIIIYKLFGAANEQPENQLKYPFKYIRLSSTQLHSSQSRDLITSADLILSSFSIDELDENPQLIVTPSSNVFRRIFKRSKSSNRARTPFSVKDESNKSNGELNADKPSTQAIINLDFVSQQRIETLIDTNININEFLLWHQVWQPKLDEPNEYLNAYSNFETLTIYLNQLMITKPANSPNESVGTFYFIEIWIDSEEENKSVNYYRTNVFKLNDKINDLCQIPFDFDMESPTKRLKFCLYKVSAASNAAHHLYSTSSSLDINRRTLTYLNNLSLSNSSNADQYCYFNLQVRFLFQSVHYPEKRIAMDLFEFKLEQTYDKERDLLYLFDIYLRNSNLSEFCLIRKFLSFFATLNTVSNDDQMNSKKNDRRNLRSI